MIKVKHSGHLGDIIYQLPFIQSIGQDIEVLIKLGIKNNFKGHSMGEYLMTEKSFELIKPLLESCYCIKKVSVYNDEIVDYDLDLFRKENLNLSGGNIQLWNTIVYPEIRPMLSLPVFMFETKKEDYILINRTSRYNNRNISYGILEELNRPLKFVGTDKEFEDIQSEVEDIERIEITNYLELLHLINQSWLFVGNQSSPFALAEMLKCRRILEQFVEAPNVIPCGGEWFTFHNQNQFKKIIESLK